MGYIFNLLYLLIMMYIWIIIISGNKVNLNILLLKKILLMNIQINLDNMELILMLVMNIILILNI